MVSVYKYIRLLAKLILTLIILFAVFTFHNNSVKRSRIRHFKIWQNMFRTRIADVKYILIWSNDDKQLNVLKQGNEAFIDNKCVFDNCFVTTDRKSFNDDYRNFDAILITAKNIFENEEMPNKRFGKQTFVFTSTESAMNYPVCDRKFDDYFNVTWTYKLNSDVAWTPFTVYNSKHEEIAPKSVVHWTVKINQLKSRTAMNVKDFKKFAVAWFTSNCHTISKRENFVGLLRHELRKYGHLIDVVGKCGNRQCSVLNEKKCMSILEQYYFYLAFENALSEDYVTKKVLMPLFHYTVPVVFGGANYSRFLPSHSFINAYELGAKETANKMSELITNQSAYSEYFKWHNYYVIKNETKSICKLCKYLNLGRSHVYRNLREWWNPNYNSICRNRTKKTRRWRKSKKLRFRYLNNDIEDNS